MNRVVLFAAVVACAAGCARPRLESAREAMRPVSPPALDDDLPLEPLFAAIEAQAAHLERREGPRTFVFGEREIEKGAYLAALRRFVSLGRSTPDKNRFLELVRGEFEFLEVYGDRSWGDVFMTSYFEPVLRASRTPTRELSQPLYGKPPDLIAVDLQLFDPKFKDERKYRGRVEGGRLLPYYSREEIDGRGALEGRGLELFWVDPVDAFVLQIQGSGTLELGAGEQLRVGYAEKNGHRYEAIGKFLKPFIAPAEVTLQSIEAYLRKLPRAELQGWLNKNPSYVFFTPTSEPAVTSLGVPATAGRTIATDGKFFPKGGLAFLMSTKPRFGAGDTVEGWDSFSRFVLDQDVGGAITGGGRLDLFWGRGDDAKRNAGVIKQRGTLYYLVPRS